MKKIIVRRLHASFEELLQKEPAGSNLKCNTLNRLTVADRVLPLGINSSASETSASGSRP